MCVCHCELPLIIRPDTLSLIRICCCVAPQTAVSTTKRPTQSPSIPTRARADRMRYAYESHDTERFGFITTSGGLRKSLCRAIQ
ncbi:hypothetical protein CAter282_0119 [Collimonas arenae]|uniref:Uncharacterized protein n=1 Tax=Collimonas arenae TaxID=279058 RepID=A0A127QCZ3_9BURK|nr:hypothetical protein CAter10_0127 [Collimonas arenae]AMP07943.1 hypothetical protein CAter282_0119 [Collimonas arenae]